MAITTIPAMSLALIIFGIKGFTMAATPLEGATEMHAGLGAVFTFSPYILIIPVLTLTMIALRVPTLVTLAGSAVMGAVAMFIFQPHFGLNAFDMARIVWAGSNPDTGFQAVDDFIATGGISGILPVVCLVASAMIFGWVMIGTGMLESVTAAVTRAIRRPVSAVAATIVSGMSLNMATADQYLSIIISGNMYRGGALPPPAPRVAPAEPLHRRLGVGDIAHDTLELVRRHTVHRSRRPHADISALLCLQLPHPYYVDAHDIHGVQDTPSGASDRLIQLNIVNYG